MAETLLSPGVLTRENDQSQITQGPVTAGAAILGPTVKGPVEVPTLVTSYSDYINRFGGTFISGGTSQEYLTSISAYNYFQQGGNTLLVTRVVDNAFTPATASVQNSISSIAGDIASVSIDVSNFTADSTGSFISVAIATSDESNIYYFVPSTFDFVNTNLDYAYFNVNSGSSTWTLDQWGAALSNAINNFIELGLTSSYNAGTLLISGSTFGSNFNGYTAYFTPPGQGIGYDLNQYAVSSSLSGGTDGTSDEVFVLETLSEGVIMNSADTGSNDNVKWEIVGSDTQTGTFSLLVRRGDDNNNSKVILESWSNLSLDPNQPNYIEAVIGNQTVDTSQGYVNIGGDYTNKSRYVRVKQVNYTTPNYFDNNGTPVSAYTSSLPIVSSGLFGGATGTLTALTINGGAYTSSINLLSNKDEFRFNVITAPGQITGPAVTGIATLATDRGDCISIIDITAKGDNVLTAVQNAASYDNSYATTYYPWVQVTAPNTGKLTWVPPSTVIPGMYAFNDRVGGPWFAPAGFLRGGLNVIQAERKLSPTDRDTLYQGRINSLATFPGQGVVAYGQKTLQKKASALDRVNVRRLLIELKSFIGQIGNSLVFEQNTIATRNRFLSQVNPYLDSIQQRQGLFAYKVVMDDSNNTADVIDRNQLVGQIFIQPTRTAEFIILDFNVTPTGASFE
jgi:phage tail sheath protein FI